MLLGVGSGLIAAAALARLLRTRLFQTEPLDPLTFAATALVLMAVAAFASFVPASRHADMPTEALPASSTVAAGSSDPAGCDHCRGLKTPAPQV